jgi:hypothetical protein
LKNNRDNREELKNDQLDGCWENEELKGSPALRSIANAFKKNKTMTIAGI